MNSAMNQKVTRVMNAVAAGTTDQNSSSVDMTGFEGVVFYALFGTITASAVTSTKLQQSSDNSTFADLAGTAIVVNDDDDNQIVVYDLSRPTDRYVRLVIDRGTQNAVIDGVVAVQYGPRDAPTTDDSSTVISRETHIGPAEGTA